MNCPLRSGGRAVWGPQAGEAPDGAPLESPIHMPFDELRNMPMPPIILASQSPRRRQLLAQAGVKDFTIVVPAVDECCDASLSPAETVCAISRRKALAVAEEASGALVIAADTMVFLDNLRLGKPHSPEEAFYMMTDQNCSTHQDLTGLTLTLAGRTETAAESTAVTFRPLTDGEKWAYIRSGEPMDKAGAYGVQGQAALFIPAIAGDYFNVMGLPLHLLGRMLQGFGMDLLEGGGSQ